MSVSDATACHQVIMECNFGEDVVNELTGVEEFFNVNSLFNQAVEALESGQCQSMAMDAEPVGSKEQSWQMFGADEGVDRGISQSHSAGDAIAAETGVTVAYVETYNSKQNIADSDARMPASRQQPPPHYDDTGLNSMQSIHLGLLSGVTEGSNNDPDHDQSLVRCFNQPRPKDWKQGSCMKTSPPQTSIRQVQGRSHDLMISDYCMDPGDVGGTCPQDFSTLHDHSMAGADGGDLLYDPRDLSQIVSLHCIKREEDGEDTILKELALLHGETTGLNCSSDDSTSQFGLDTLRRKRSYGCLSNLETERASMDEFVDEIINKSDDLFGSWSFDHIIPSPKGFDKYFHGIDDEMTPISGFALEPEAKRPRLDLVEFSDSSSADSFEQELAAKFNDDYFFKLKNDFLASNLLQCLSDDEDEGLIPSSTGRAKSGRFLLDDEIDPSYSSSALIGSPEKELDDFLCSNTSENNSKGEVCDASNSQSGQLDVFCEPETWHRDADDVLTLGADVNTSTMPEEKWQEGGKQSDENTPLPEMATIMESLKRKTIENAKRMLDGSQKAPNVLPRTSNESSFSCDLPEILHRTSPQNGFPKSDNVMSSSPAKVGTPSTSTPSVTTATQQNYETSEPPRGVPDFSGLQAVLPMLPFPLPSVPSGYCLVITHQSLQPNDPNSSPASQPNTQVIIIQPVSNGDNKDTQSAAGPGGHLQTDMTRGNFQLPHLLQPNQTTSQLQPNQQPQNQRTHLAVQTNQNNLQTSTNNQPLLTVQTNQQNFQASTNQQPLFTVQNNQQPCQTPVNQHQYLTAQANQLPPFSTVVSNQQTSFVHKFQSTNFQSVPGNQNSFISSLPNKNCVPSPQSPALDLSLAGRRNSFPTFQAPVETPSFVPAALPSPSSNQANKSFGNTPTSTHASLVSPSSAQTRQILPQSSVIDYTRIASSLANNPPWIPSTLNQQIQERISRVLQTESQIHPPHVPTQRPNSLSISSSTAISKPSNIKTPTPSTIDSSKGASVSSTPCANPFIEQKPSPPYLSNNCENDFDNNYMFPPSVVIGPPSQHLTKASKPTPAIPVAPTVPPLCNITHNSIPKSNSNSGLQVQISPKSPFTPKPAAAQFQISPKSPFPISNPVSNSNLVSGSPLPNLQPTPSLPALLSFPTSLPPLPATTIPAFTPSELMHDVGIPTRMFLPSVTLPPIQMTEQTKRLLSNISSKLPTSVYPPAFPTPCITSVGQSVNTDIMMPNLFKLTASNANSPGICAPNSTTIPPNCQNCESMIKSQMVVPPLTGINSSWQGFIPCLPNSIISSSNGAAGFSSGNTPALQGLAKTSEGATLVVTPSSHSTTPISPHCTSVVEPDSTVHQTTTESSKKIMQALSDKIKRNQLQKMIFENTVSTTVAMDSAATILTPNSDKALLSPTTESPELLPARLHPVRSLSCNMTSPTNDTKYRGFDVKAESNHLHLSNDSIRNDSPQNVKPKHLNNSSTPRKRTVSHAVTGSSRRTSGEVVIGKADTSHDMLQVRRMSLCESTSSSDENSSDEYENVTHRHISFSPKRGDEKGNDVFEFFLDAPMSSVLQMDEDKITYLNKGQYYRLLMECNAAKSKSSSKVFRSVVMVLFRDNLTVGDELDAWKLWHSRQQSFKQRILDIDYKNSCGVGPNSMQELSYNATSVTWKPVSQPVKVNVAVNCLSTDFSNQKGVKGIPLHIQIDTYDESTGDIVHRAYSKIKVFCDKGAERKVRDEERKKETRNKSKSEIKPENKNDTIPKSPVNLICEKQSNFYPLDDFTKIPVLFTPESDVSIKAPSSEKKAITTPSLLYGSIKTSVESDDEYSATPTKRSKPTSSNLVSKELKRVLLYVRDAQDTVFTALMLSHPTVSALMHAIQEKCNISKYKIKNIYKKSKKGILVKMDDKIIRHYSNESTFVISTQSTHSKDDDNNSSYDVILTEIDA